MNIRENQTKIIKDHLQLVFKKETPKYYVNSLDLKLDNYKTNQGFNLSPNLNKDIFCSINSNVSC